jgi:hypothetical protein
LAVSREKLAIIVNFVGVNLKREIAEFKYATREELKIIRQGLKSDNRKENQKSIIILILMGVGIWVFLR